MMGKERLIKGGEIELKMQHENVKQERKLQRRKCKGHSFDKY